jgi:ribulose kinase
MPEERIPKLILEWVPAEKRKRERPRKTWMEVVHAVMTAEKFRTKSMEKQGVTAFGFRMTATAVIEPDR